MSTAKPQYLPSHTDWQASDTPDQCAQQLADQIASCLTNGLQQRQRASVALSGGRTPTAMFVALSHADIPWERVDVTLVDERWVNEQDPASNAALVRQHLLQNAAAAANFVPMYNGAATNTLGTAQCNADMGTLSAPIDVVILGMGSDGHTASLFPHCPHLAQALADDNMSRCMATSAPTEPSQRMTLTARTLQLSRHTFLHLVGDDKLDTLEQAMSLRNPAKMPIFAFLQRPLSIFWSPSL